MNYIYDIYDIHDISQHMNYKKNKPMIFHSISQ